MAKSEKNKIPPARIAHHRLRRLAPISALLRPLRRLRFGRSEFAALSIASGIVLLTGLMLAGFGAANKEGLADRYTAKASDAEAESSQRLRSKCTLVSSNGESCEDTWDRAMSGIEVSLWKGDTDWAESECKYTYLCYEQTEVPASAQPELDESRSP